MKTSNEVGNRYSSLTVIERGPNAKSGTGVKAMWLCRCDCGKETTVAGNHLRSGHAKSCGCRRKDPAVYGPRNRKFRLPGTEAGFRQVLSNTKCQAKKRNLEWGISDEDARSLFSSSCFYCGSPPMAVHKDRYDATGQRDFLYNGIDRVDNDLGYIHGNIVPCCGFCNRAKGTKSYDEFVAWLKRCFMVSNIPVREWGNTV